MNKITLILITLIFASITGCKLGPNFQRPEYDGPASFRFDAGIDDTLINLRWWELFEDDVLDTLIAMALENNKDIRMAAARVETARASLGFTKADQWPAIGYNVGASTGNSVNGIATLNDISSNYFAYPEMTWEIGFWGKYRRLNESARAELLASEYGLRTVQISLISAVASTYFTMLDNISKLEISERTLAARDSSTFIVQSRFEYGIVPKIDLNQAQIQRSISAAAVPLYKRAIVFNENTLSILLGKFPDTIPYGVELFNQKEPPDIPIGIPSQLLSRRPDVLQAEAEYAAQNALIGAAKAMRWPSLSLTGLLGIASSELSALTTSGLGWSASGVIFGPLLQFGKNKRRVEIEKASAEVALRFYENTALQAFKDVEDALVSIRWLREELIANEERYNAAINAEFLSAQRYDKGQTSYLEVLESQRQSFDAQLSYSTTRRDLLGAHLALYKALGGGWLSPEEEQAFIRAQ